MSINKEKQEIIEIDGNVLITANPGTGKTRLLAYKYIDLIKKGIKPEDILCLTFTEKAKHEMENRIIEAIKNESVLMDTSQLNVYTFHSFALNNIEEQEIVTSNLLRYTIYKYLTDNEILNYGDDYLIETIVPKMENLIRYLKSFGITPEQIEVEEAKKYLELDEKNSKEELEKFLVYFCEIFKHYEEVKDKKGLDYADLLINFLKIGKIRKYEYVLVDELQDVNILEAEIALRSSKHFIAVGDKKQAIFGFQGGSILNFNKFENSTKAVLSENFRSTNQILKYAKAYFMARTKEDSHKKDLIDLRNADGLNGEKPIIYDVDRDNVYSVACELTKNFKGKTAIIARTNQQVAKIGKELKARNIDFSSTFYSASNDAKMHIITFLKGILSSNIQDIKNSMFTPFFPCSLQDAFVLAQEKDVDLNLIYEKIPLFKKLRESVKTVEDVNNLFINKIIPVCISYGKEYLSAAVNMQNSYQEALNMLSEKNISSLTTYLLSTDLLSQELEMEKNIVVTTVHKAKGVEYDNVIYLPSKTVDRSNFQDKVVEAILKSKGISAKEELEEETMRVNFVAFTRAKNNLVILTDRIQDYLNDEVEIRELESIAKSEIDLDEKNKRAYNLFVNGDFEGAKKLLENKETWIKNYVKNYFDLLDHTSFSSLPESAYDFFVNKILNLKKESFAIFLGSEVHSAAEMITLGKEANYSNKAKPYVENVKKLILEIKKTYPNAVNTELLINLNLKELGFDSELRFTGLIDAIFKNEDNYLIVDWKTDKNDERSSKHKQQLEVYRRIYSIKNNVPLNKIKVAIGFVGLRPTINTGAINCKLDVGQPAKTSFETFSKRVNKLLNWRKNVDLFFKDFEAEKIENVLWKSVVEEWKKELLISIEK